MLELSVILDIHMVCQNPIKSANRYTLKVILRIGVVVLHILSLGGVVWKLPYIPQPSTPHSVPVRLRRPSPSPKLKNTIIPWRQIHQLTLVALTFDPGETWRGLVRRGVIRTFTRVDALNGGMGTGFLKA